MPNGQLVEDVFVIASKTAPKPYGNGKGFMFTMELQDAKGRIGFTYFGTPNQEEVQQFYNSLSLEQVVYVKAAVNVYRDTTSLLVNDKNSVKVLKLGEYAAEDFVRVSTRSISEMQKELLEYVALVSDTDIRKVLEYLFVEDKTLVQAFSSSSAAMGRHHAWVGGLLEHSLNLTSLVLAAQKRYPELNTDYLIAGALLQDIGKTRELSTGLSFKFTPEGTLIGHIVLGTQILAEAAEKVGLPDEKRNKLLHLILSHHETKEQGSPVEPAFPEALVVALADNLDAQTASILDEIKAYEGTAEFSVRSRNHGHLYTK